MTTEIRILSEYIAAAIDIVPSDTIRAKARQHTLDTIGAIVSGSHLLPGRSGAEYVAAQGGMLETSSILGTPLRSTPSLAALANGMSAHADETDDSHEMSLGHPGCGVVPAALAVAEATNSTVDELLRAVTLGYDVGARIILAIGTKNLMPLFSGIDTHAFANVFGAAAAAAALWRLPPQQAAWVMSYAAQQAAGLFTWLRDRNHVEKAFVFAGMPARNGVAAAEMVRLGWDATDDVFTGSPNFLSTFSKDPDARQLVDGLGHRFEIARTNIKKYAVGSPAQAVLQALEDMIAEEPIDAKEVERVEVLMPSDLAIAVNNRPMPDVNVHYLVAGTLIDGRASFAMAHDYDRLQQDGQVRKLMQKVELADDPTMAALSRQARVEIHLRGGRSRQRHVAAVRGTWQNPILDKELEDKVLDLIEPILGPENSRRAITMVLESRQCGRTVDLACLLRAPAAARQA